MLSLDTSFGDEVALRARGLPGVESFKLARWRGRVGTLNDEPLSESAPGDAVLDTGVGLRIVKDTFGVEVDINKEWLERKVVWGLSLESFEKGNSLKTPAYSERRITSFFATEMYR
jgi:hypothetical protein